ncbi:MAG: hypothetical protein BMS9Abin28_1884 [Anaerolineae bacterium]|nr:MAG: hypothetical protein BMS9Abin28_1884 [Anaerolineae bacterium]
MPTIVDDWELALDIDQVLRGQGAKPDIIRKRSPNLVEVAERAIAEGSSLIKPRLIYRRMALESVMHERLLLRGGGKLQSSLLAQHLSPAEEIVFVVCTIGADIDSWTSEAFKTDPLFAVSLDGLGNAAVEDLAKQACRHFEKAAREKRMEVSIPLSPGMQGWPVDDGQDQIFGLLPAQKIGVKLNRSRMMSPSKSLSMAIGIGKHLAGGGRQCDFCMLNKTCRYKDLYV